MAYYDDEDDKLAATEPGSGNQTLGPESSEISGQGAAASQAPQAKNPGNFVGIQQYIQANKPQAERLGGQVAGTVSNITNQAQSDAGMLKSEADKVITGPKEVDEQVFQKLETSPGQLSQEERQRVIDNSKASYKGPTDVTGFGDLYNKASQSSQKANQALKDTQSEQGRINLITQTSGGKRTQGMNVFDQALLGAGSGLQKIQQTAQQAETQGVPKVLDNTVKDINQKITDVSGKTSEVQQTTNKKIQDSLNNWMKQFQGQGVKDDPNTPVNEEIAANRAGTNGRLAKAQQQLKDKNDPLLNDLQDLNLDQSTLQMLGLDPDEYVYDVNLQNFVNPADISKLNLANAATTEDYSNYEALAQLAGIDPSLLDPSKITQAGTGKFDPTVQKDALRQAIAGAQKRATDEGAQQLRDSINHLAGNYNLSTYGLDPNKIGTGLKDAEEQLANFNAKANPIIKAILAGGNPMNMDAGYLQRVRERHRIIPELQQYIQRLKSGRQVKKN